ncbi:MULTISPECIES: arginine--tRNA ligase [Bacillota]|uniref:Arginine--tRNA ligase n=2 Tax=Amedibacillus TaxID=2749846 RepID=A0A7G9GQ14_9FIRM|nr:MULTISPECIES: arginine--tRNA ligase [Bacillota]QNM12896.1 arginine--tRNA ligase [[Eubacterium] hominis]MCH4286778.1 arginine--tRNA ligase [Amedibacillus hominis]RGB58145.1 arginine--tRNA ligase [Absiella sp. AM22-9]RGB59918.1 arginine--tRNA ligase [Absiella sp. AM10-20]RGB66045.1 arginine--tRNA ligase [Absiella sp. AM09-45]
MNQIEMSLKHALKDAVSKAFGQELQEDNIVIEIPKDKSHGDYSTNVAMQLTRILKNNPRKIAEGIMEALDKDAADIESCEIAGPGFINFKIKNTSLAKIIETVLAQGDNFGHNDTGHNIKVNVEYVSANPTGDLHLGHARGAAWGDSITRLMKASGYDVCREYYVNDAGNQIINLGKSLQARYREHMGLDFVLPEDGYHGEDVKKIAIELAETYKDTYVEENEENLKFFKEKGIEFELNKIKRDLDYFRVHFDVWSSEQKIRDDGKVEAALKVLDEKGMTYEKDGALWFATTKFNDDKDRVLRKTDGSYTYLVPDIAYHKDKLDRGFDMLVDLLGADHHGYIPRLKASIEALGNDPDKLQVDIIQMVRLVENGEEVKMSKRLGNAVTIRELCDEVGVDAVRYFFVQRAVDTHFDFDLGLARKQSNDNPVYYAQYAHARMCSILRQAPEMKEAENFDLLTHEKEIALMKYINEFTNVVADAAKTRSPHKVCNYIQKLAAYFHSFYNACKVIDMEHEELSAQRLALLKATKITLKNALELIGVEAIEKM